MRVRWTTDAANDLERICDYIAKTSPNSARRIAQAVVEGVASLDTFPNRGRPGRVEGTRELVFAPLPFVAVYEVHEEVHRPRFDLPRPLGRVMRHYEVAFHGSRVTSDAGLDLGPRTG